MSKTILSGIKDLKISAPSVVDQAASKLKCSVIVVAKYDFEAETADELSMRKGDVLKLLDRLANGWVLVKYVDRMVPPGLVPSLYVDIAVNDPMNPITVQWLHEVSLAGDSPNASFCDAQVRQLLESNAPLTFNNKPYPLTVLVSNYLMYENRFWYRVDVTYSTGEQGYLCRYYQNFYDLHVSLLDTAGAAEAAANGADTKLPKLPEPVPSKQRDSTELSDLFSKRCRELSVYMNDLVLKKHYQVCPALMEWLSVDYEGLPGFVVDDALNDSSDAISQRILEGSVILASKTKTVALERKKSVDENGKYTVPRKGSLQRAKSKNIYNHYHQVANYYLNNMTRLMSTSEGGPHRRPSGVDRLRTVSGPSGVDRLRTVSGPSGVDRLRTVSGPSSAPGMSTPRNKHTHTFGSSPHTPQLPTPKTPSTPPKSVLLASTPTSQRVVDNLNLVRCKIKTQTNDNVVVRLDRRDITTVDLLKKLVYRKIAFNNLYVRLDDAYEEVDSLDVDVLGILHSSDKLYLLVT